MGKALQVLTVLGLIWLVVALSVAVGVELRTQSLYVQNGWTESYVDWNLRGYCVRWEAGTQRIEPLSEVLKGGRYD